METKYFGDLGAKLKEASTVVTQHNNYAAYMAETQGVQLPRYDLQSVKRAIIKKHRKYYGMTNKYDGKGNLREV